MTRRGSKDTPAIQLSRKGLAGWLAVFLLVAVWTFVVGVLVGRGTAPVHFDMEKIQQQLTEIRAEILKREEKRIPLDTDTDTARRDLDFYEDLKKDESETPVLAPEFPKPVEKPAASRVVKKPEEKPEKSITKTPAAGKYTIQVASLQDPATAQKMVEELKSMGYPAYRTTAEISGTTWHRVRIGEFASRSDAGVMFKKLSGEGYKGILVVW